MKTYDGSERREDNGAIHPEVRDRLTRLEIIGESVIERIDKVVYDHEMRIRKVESQQTWMIAKVGALATGIVAVSAWASTKLNINIGG